MPEDRRSLNKNRIVLVPGNHDVTAALGLETKDIKNRQVLRKWWHSILREHGHLFVIHSGELKRFFIHSILTGSIPASVILLLTSTFQASQPIPVVAAAIDNSVLPRASVVAIPQNAPAPTVTNISPAQAYNYQPTTITISGTNFVPTPTVTLGNTSLSNITFVNSTTITATVPADLPGGSYALTVTNPDSQNATLANAFTVYPSGDGSLATWQIISTMGTGRRNFAAVSVGGYLYVIGGWNFGSYFLNNVERAAINADGSLGSWATMTSLATPREGLAAVAAGGYLYALGGENSNGYLNIVERAAINPDGSLGPWQATTSMNAARIYFQVVAVGNYLYAIGGYNGGPMNSVEMAPINPDGSLGPWQNVTNLSPARSNLGAVGINGYVYVIGGWSGGSDVASYMSNVDRAKVNSDGSLGSWQTMAAMIEGKSDLIAVAAGGYIYAIGGYNPYYGYYFGSNVQQVIVNADGSLGSWQNSSWWMQSPRYRLAAVAVGPYLYALVT